MKTLLEELTAAILEDTAPTSELYQNALEASKGKIVIFGDRIQGYKKRHLPAEQQQARIYADYTDKYFYPHIRGEQRKQRFIQFLKETIG